jgi:hypothetical protein
MWARWRSSLGKELRMLTTYVLNFLIGTFLSWVSLLIVVPISQRLAEFSFPPWEEALWKLLVVAAAASLVSTVVGSFSGFLALIVGGIMFWSLMVKWFDVDMFGAIIIVVITRALNYGLLVAVAGILSGMHLI